MRWKTWAAACGWLLLAGAVAGADAQGATAPPKPPHAPPAHHAPPGAAFSIAPLPAWVQPLVVDPSAVVASAPYQVLLSDRQVRVTSGTEEDFVHTVGRVNDASALQQAGQLAVEFDPTFQKIVFHKIDVLRGNQRIDKLATGKIQVLHRETQLERQTVDGRMTASLVIDDLRPGDRVEVEITIAGADPVFAGRFVDTGWSQRFDAPIGQYQYRLLAPAARAIRFQSGDAATEVSSTVHGTERETLVRRHDVPQLPFDEHAPAGEYLKAQFEFSEFSDWADVERWAQGLFAPAMQATPALDAEVAALQAKAANPADRVRAALDFVQKDIRYFGTELGMGTHRPAPVDTTIAQRFGDCKDKAVLLSALLSRMGVDATPVLASLRYRAATAGRLPSPLAFDHVIVRAVVDGTPLFLDATRAEQTGAVASRQALGMGAGLEVRPAVNGLTTLPGAEDALQTEVVDTFHFAHLAQEGTLDSVVIYHGDIAEGLRSAIAIRPASDIERGLTSATLRAYPSLALVGQPELDTQRDDDSVKVTTHYRTGDFWTFPEQRVLDGHFLLWSLVDALRLPDQAPRTHPLEIVPGRYRHKTVFAFDEESRITPGSPHVDEDNAHFELHVQYETRPDRQMVDAEARIKRPVIAPEDWSAYRDDLMKASRRLGGDVQVPPLSPGQADALRAEFPKLMEDLRAGRVQAPTRAQATARTRILVLDKVIASGRLPPRLLAQALVERGEHLDHVGRADDARESFRQAATLDAANADAHDGLAVNAFIRRADDEALREVDETLRLAPSNTHIRFTRAWADYFDNRLPDAREELRSILQSRSEIERSYGVIWLYLATRRLGDDAAGTLKTYRATSAHPEWPHAVLEYFSGEMDMDALLSASHENGQPSRERECELYLYLAEKAIADGEPERARGLLKKSLATQAVEEIEYGMAQRELDRLARR